MGDPASTATTAYDVAIIGMEGRFPGASNVAEFWRNLRQGVETVSFFSDEELEEPVEPAGVSNPAYIKAHGVLDGVELFDANFFNIPSREAKWIDPQQRLFLESAWAALEHAGYDVERYSGLISVYAGLNANTYLLSRLDQLTTDSSAESFLVYLSSDKDYLATRVSYKLNLRGESITIQTACSTSLVAVHLACQSLLSGQCDMALAGGVSIRLPQKTGYFYSEGMISSPDGHCRSFDLRAQGTLPANGLGIVVLKRLDDALADRDYIHAVIKGSAVNNDGRSKIGYTAPSIDGQADVIAKALDMADVPPDTLGFIEGHGTGTPIGDPIEVAALTRVFRRSTSAKNFCALGSVKSNFGHLDNAAGIAGLIKATLALQHKAIPPTVHFEQPNPALNLEESPFFVNRELIEWPNGKIPRRAGVSSFGIGGTNVHVILEEAPARRVTKRARRCQLLTLSAKTPTALRRMAEMLADHLEQNAEVNLADVAFTRNVGRSAFSHRRFVVANNRQEAVSALRAASPATDPARFARTQGVVFMFPGQGVQCLQAGRDIYETEPGFRQPMDECARHLKIDHGMDLLRFLYPLEGEESEAAARLAQPEFGLPALLSLEYSLARCWMSWGIEPQAMIGHSFGEYAAACLSGVFSLADGLGLAVTRGRLIQKLPQGAMLAVRLGAEDAQPFLNAELSLSSVNSDNNCVISGPVAAIERLEQKLSDRQVAARRLDVTYAYHSSALEPILPDFTAVVDKLVRNAPALSYVSGWTGTWIRAEEAGDPNYWARQMREPVLFATGLDTLVEGGGRIFLEVGPGQSLSMISRAHLRRHKGSHVIASISHPPEAGAAGSEGRSLFEAVGRLWTLGEVVDWESFYRDEESSRVPLPTYPFERERYWIEARPRRKTAASNGSEEIHFTPVEADSKHQVQRWESLQKYQAPRNDLERALADIWGDVLGLQDIGVDDGLFELGGDSLLATRIFSRLNQTFSVEVSLADILKFPSISELSRIIQHGVWGAEESGSTVYHCSFETSIGDEDVTVFMPKEEFLRIGLPDGARNFRLL